MASITTPSSYPNILTVTGDDVFGSDSEYRDRLRDILYRDYTFPYPVRRGSHDFWITYRVPNPPDMGSNWSREDIGIGDWNTRRPMRGIVFMDLPTDDSDATMVGQLGTILQEVGHHWLVPPDLRFHTPQGEARMLDLREIVDTQNNEQGWTQPALIGREHIHWSTYWDADHSPFDGVHWDDRGAEHGVTRWDHQLSPEWPYTQQTTAVNISGTIWRPPSPPRRILLRAKYNDLDLILMDALSPTDAYPDRGNEVRWFQPFLTSNMNSNAYHVGITVALSRFDQIYFGFFRDHRKLAVQRTGRELSPIADLGERRNLFRQTALRVVKRGQRLLFQAAEPETSDLINAPSNDVLPFAGLTRDRFNTVAVLNVRERPVGVGVLLKTWGYPLLVEADYSEIVLSDRLGRRSFPVDRDPVEFPRDAPYQNALSSNEIRRFDMPGPPLLDRASFVRTHPQDRVLQLGARYCVNPITGDPVNLENADHWDGVDRAPKALVQVQSGNFTFGVRMRVRRCIFSPWTAGGAVGSTIWGHYGRRIFARDIIIPSRIRERWRGNSMLLFAFIVVARRDSDITENQLAIIDHIRRFWDTIFNVVTRGRWTSNSNLWPAVYEPEPIA